MNTNTSPSIKEMSDVALAQYVTDLRRTMENAANMQHATGMGWMLRHLDIAIAVKRQRQRTGTWTGPEVL